jgi:trans-aconitate methyltransferase
MGELTVESDVHSIYTQRLPNIKIQTEWTSATGLVEWLQELVQPILINMPYNFSIHDTVLSGKLGK